MSDVRRTRCASRRTPTALTGWLPQPPDLVVAHRALGLLIGAIAGALGLALAAGAFVPIVAEDAADLVEVEYEGASEAPLADLPERSRVVSADGTELAVLAGEENRETVSIDTVPEHVQRAVLAAEDRRFYSHDGYDVHGIGRAALANLQTEGISQGGSTITQQVAKQNFTDGAQTLDRKLTELSYAVALEREHDKDEILERYLNEVYFGHGAYGIAAAAEEFFDAEPRELTVEQGATLAAMIRAPGLLDPRDRPDRVEERRDAVLAAMASHGWITRPQYELAAAMPVEAEPPRERKVREPFVVEAVRRELLNDPDFADTREERVAKLYRGGLEITATIDLDLQEQAQEVAAEAPAPPEDATAAIASVDPDTGALLAAASGRDFDDDQYDPALQGRRQPGSAMKSYVLAAALEDGADLDDEVDASGPAELDYGGDEDWEVGNYDGADYGDIPLEEAFARSSNTAFARLILDIGQEPVEDVLDRLGVDVDAALGTERALTPAMAIGGVGSGFSPLEMATAHGAFLNDGHVAPPHVVDQVRDREGDVIYRPESEPQQAVDTEVAQQVDDAMREVVTDGTGSAADIPDERVRGKTGTSQSFADAWFVGGTDDMATAVWVGDPSARTPMPGVTGGEAPAEVWREFTEEALARAPELGTSESS